MALKACIFDLDGTLADTAQDLRNAVNTVMAAHGYPTFSEPEIKQMVGNGIRNLIERSIPEAQRTPEQIDLCLGEFKEYYREHLLDETHLYDGMLALVEVLHQKGVRLAVISNKADPLVQKIVSTLFPGTLFDSVSGMRTDIRPKPAPDALLVVCEQFGIRPEECAMVGDSDIDMITAHNAGMPGYGVTWGFRSRENLESSGATALADTADELSALLLA